MLTVSLLVLASTMPCLNNLWAVENQDIDEFYNSYNVVEEPRIKQDGIVYECQDVNPTMQNNEHCNYDISEKNSTNKLNIQKQNANKSQDINKNQNTNKNQNNYKVIKVPYINQNNIVYGCEAVSSTMLVKFYGYDISEKNFTDKYLIKKSCHKGSNGKIYGPDPYSAYSGNPYISQGENCGYGSYAPSTAKSINKILNKKKHVSKAIIGLTLEDIIKNYIDKDIPALVWATVDMKPSSPGNSWTIDYVDENSRYKIGDKFTWTKHEHCLVLVGYDNKNYYFNDPYKNHGLISYDKNLVNQRFKELGSQAVVILKP